MAFAWLAVLTYPIGLLLVTASLLFSHRAELTGTAPPTKLGSALSFLYESFTPMKFYWELFEMTRDRRVCTRTLATHMSCDMSYAPPRSRHRLPAAVPRSPQCEPAA